MNLQEQIRSDMVEAMKSKDTETVSLLRVVAGEFGRVGKDLTDEQALKVIRRMSETAKELGNESEVLILDKYLPQMLGESQITVLAAGIISKNEFSGMQDMGKVMGELKKLPTSHLIDGKLASTIVRKLLG
ncbi:MAG: GatB/YqeY domain-containing protein [Draconibacterium sp.]|nr:GatB/YqeY domain-containing protein [Draconibacterium sp.]